MKCKIANMSCLFLCTDREFNHPIQQTTQNKSEYQQENMTYGVVQGKTHLFMSNASWERAYPIALKVCLSFLLGRYPHKQLCCSSHKCMFLTNVPPFKREIN